MVNKQYAPIVLFTYNRVSHTKKVIKALTKSAIAKHSDLWVFSDGAKSSKELEQVLSVRLYISKLKGQQLFNNVFVIEAQENKGLVNSIITGVDEVISKYGMVIVLEDDIVTAPDFLKFMNECLSFYKKEKKIGSITGYSPLKDMPNYYDHDVFLHPRNCSYGWATWQNRWISIDWKLNEFKSFVKNRRDVNRFNKGGGDMFRMLYRQYEGQAQSWAIVFGFWQFKSEIFTIYPVVSRVKNIGWDGSGVHFSGKKGKLNAEDIYNCEINKDEMPFELSIPEVDERVIAKMSNLYTIGYKSQIKRYLLQKFVQLKYKIWA